MFRIFSIQLIVCFIFLTIIRPVENLKCLDEDEHEVDWYIAYKLPKLTKGSTGGDTLVYVTSRTIKIEQNWIYSPKPIDSNNSIIAATLNQIYLNPQMFNYVQYNDEIPTSISQLMKKATTGSVHSAHAKGVVAFDSNEGFWLIHSIPKFPPPLNQHYEYPSTALHYGQTALCISFESSESKTNQVLNQLLVMRPTIYAHNFADNIFQNDWSRLINKNWSTVDIQTTKLISIDGVEFQSFSKNPLNEIEIYEDSVAIELKQSLNVETWRDGSGEHLKSNCSLKYHVYNVENVRINAVDKDLITQDDNLLAEQLSKGFFDVTFDLMKKAAKNLISDNHAFSFKYTVDHSKWAISNSKEDPYVCIGDLNRVHSQAKRGGGVVCQSNLDLWTIFSKSIQSFEPC